jgi:MFS family permease
VGILFMVIGITSAFVQGVLTGPLTRRWGEANVIRVSLIASAAGFFILTQVNTLPAVIAAVCFFIISNAMLNPANSSLISKRTEGRQGLVMGLNNSYQSLGRIIGPVWAGLVYDLNYKFPLLERSSRHAGRFCPQPAAAQPGTPHGSKWERRTEQLDILTAISPLVNVAYAIAAGPKPPNHNRTQ